MRLPGEEYSRKGKQRINVEKYNRFKNFLKEREKNKKGRRKKKGGGKKKENSTELQKPNVEAEAHNNKSVTEYTHMHIYP